MTETVKTITSLDGSRRIVVFQRPEGTFGFGEFFFDEREQVWCPLESRRRSYTAVDTLERILQEIVGRVPRAREVIEAK